MTAKGHVRKSIVLTLDAVAYECEITKATLTPAVETKTTAVLCADGSASDVGEPAWTLDVDYLVDHNADSFYRFCVANTGALAEFVYEPDPINAAGVLYTGNLRVVPGPAGGAAGEWEAGAVSLPINGQPVITDPAPLDDNTPAPGSLPGDDDTP